jgi:hypothetical protein
MHYETFPHCCGMEEIGDLYGSYAELKHDITDHLATLAQDRKDIVVGTGDFCPGGLIATTTPDQKEAIRALKFHKFRKVYSFRNPGTGTKVTLWTKKLVR